MSKAPGVAMIVVGVLLAAVGGIVMSTAAGKKEHAQGVLDFSNAYSGRDDASNPALAAAVTMGHVGLGLLIFGGALLLCGLVVAALRRS